MESIRSTVSGLTYLGDDNVQHLNHSLTCSLWARDTNGEWRYVGQWHNITCPPDGELHFSGHPK